MLRQLMKLLKIKLEGELSLKKGTKIILDAPELDKGVSIFIKSEDDGKLMELPSGNYELSNNQFIIVDPDGIVKEVVDEIINKPLPDPIANSPWTNHPLHTPHTGYDATMEAEINTEGLSPVSAARTGVTSTEDKKNYLFEMTPEELQKMLEDLTNRVQALEDKISAMEQAEAGEPAPDAAPDATPDQTQLMSEKIEKMGKDIENIMQKAIFAKELPKTDSEVSTKTDNRIEIIKNLRSKRS